jgi:hypothetical protein
MSQATCDALEPILLRVLTQFYRSLDSGDVEGLSKLMAKQFVWRRQGTELRSMADIETTLSKRRSEAHFFHILTNVLFEQVRSTTVLYSGYLLVLRAYVNRAAPTSMAPSGPQSFHVCKGELALDGGQWRITSVDAGPPRLLLSLEETR